MEPKWCESFRTPRCNSHLTKCIGNFLGSIHTLDDLRQGGLTTSYLLINIYKTYIKPQCHIYRSAAGVTAVAFTYPLDTIRARLAFQVHGEHLYNGIAQCASHICREEGGIRGLYRGFTPTICGMIPYAGLSFYCFESFKYLCMKYFPGEIFFCHC